MADSIRIEFPSQGATYRREEYGVYAYGVYEASSVLAGQSSRRFLDAFPTLEEARAAYPAAEFEREGVSGYQELRMPDVPPPWFDPLAAGERWDEED